jgi:hypothetical protein
MTEAYARSVGVFKGRVLGVFRYGMSQDALGHFTAVAVRMDNLAAPSNIFDSEHAARAAIDREKSRP